MKRIFTAAALIALLAAPMFARAEEVSEEEEIKVLVLSAYVDGLINAGDLDKTRAGFHPQFVLLGLQNGDLTRLPITEWIASVEKRKAQAQAQDHKPPLMTGRFLDVDVTGTAAMVKIELHREGVHIFTDYLTLYKFPDGWKIVGKIYFRHS
ncbi:MAG: nuclear transport factor 2 family protein [Acidobacteriota bacterium]|nr:nuclear transport factor 2 family protein [Acidobacteriota bacterium]